MLAMEEDVDVVAQVMEQGPTNGGIVGGEERSLENSIHYSELH
jgi:hypothetical protein